MPLKVLIDLRRIKELRTAHNRHYRDTSILGAICTYLKEMVIFSTDFFSELHFSVECKNMTKLRKLYLTVVKPMQLRNNTLQGLTGLFMTLDFMAITLYYIRLKPTS